MSKRRVLSSLAAGAAAVAALAPAAAEADTAPAYPVGDLGTAISNFVLSPDAVAGGNIWSCKPSAEHPYPVVVVHGTTSNFGSAGATIVPTLANAGYCVYGFNYGGTQSSLGHIYGLGDIAQSAQQMSAFVDKVLAATGAPKVDVVGNSQGGMMPNYYIKRLGGASKVRTLIGLGPTNHGTTMNGLVNLGRTLNVLWLVNGFYYLIGSPAHTQQEEGSDFQTALFADGDTVPGVRYLTIVTSHDTTVTPLTNAYLHGGDTTNVLLQDLCPDDPVSHSGMFYDGPIMQLVLNEIGAKTPNFHPQCTNYGPNI
ncbi:esterase/lipase family protein [Actinomadura atramentaria]|uniref:esterase/lipase family protein n=1 Tax=Actinomadura atramentaria TaxID=1990 RepID=UPI00037650F0|nr:alpha/beta fold hydrolase [Actinomadura atramentaria]